MQKPGVRLNYQWGVANHAAFTSHLDGLIGTLRNDRGIFAADAMVAWGRTLGFLDDAAFMEAWGRNASAVHERGIIWRTAVLVWAARQAKRRDGAFVELGCYAGTTARILYEAAQVTDRPFYLYDLFEHEPGMAHHAMPEHGPQLFETVQARFADAPNVQVIKGPVPDSFGQGAPDQVAFAHIDMNQAAAEVAGLDGLETRFVPGAVIVLDDFGQLPYRQQHVAEAAWFAQRGVPILELPTGQGLAIW